MEEDNDLYSFLDGLNLTGQWQPSSTIDVGDQSLRNQILSDVVFSVDDSPPAMMLNQNDDFTAALMHPTMDPFMTDDVILPSFTPTGETPIQSRIEDTLENMTLNQMNTENIASSLCIPMGSSPVEQKEINSSILVLQNTDGQQRIHREAKARKTSAYQQSSSTVAPIDVLTSYGGCQPCTTVQIQDNFNYLQSPLQFDSFESQKIRILSNPRSEFRPRTQNESKYASHFIRCEPNSQYEYPTISIPQMWARQSTKNIIEVTLCAKDKQTHNYSIDNKQCHSVYDDEALIFRQNESHTLYFCLTKEDITNGYKSFMIEYIKSKQDGTITKELIKNRELEKSILRFTRIYQSDKNTFLRDENSVEYSTIMTEAYGDVGVEHMGPKFGPMCGNERVYALVKGRIMKDDLAVFVKEEMTGWRQQISFTKNGNFIYFNMPQFPYSQFERALTTVTIYYKGDELFQSPFVYKGSLDQELASLNLSDSTSNQSSNGFDALEFFSATDACPNRASSRRSTAAKQTKRLGNKK